MKPYYQDDYCTIYHGDCREVLARITADAALADPPYNVSLGTKPHAYRQTGYLNSSDRNQDYESLISEVSVMITSLPISIVTPGNSNQKLWPKPLWTMCWLKTNGVSRTPLTRGQKMNHACWEPILVYGKLDSPPHSDVINIPIAFQSEVNDHPCPKPIKLFSTLLSFFSGSVVDPFMGSGTTLRAAKDLGRKAIGIEIEEKYCEIAAQRLAQEVLPFSEPGSGVRALQTPVDSQQPKSCDALY